MANLEGWDWALLVVAGYVAVMSLVRLMRSHRDAILGELREKIDREQSRRQTRPTPGKSRVPGAADDRQKTGVA